MNDINHDNQKVLVLLSLYNGERFVEKQLDSLLDQTITVDVLARDDGSTDHTVELVEKYIKNNGHIRLIKGDNKGFVQSFNILLMDRVLENYDWIAFCDQDDIWLPQKLEKAIEALRKSNDHDLPLMYCSNLCLVDESLHDIGKMHPKSSKVLRSCIYIQNYATGCTMVFNKSALFKYRQGIGIAMVAHDYMMHCICKFFGKVIYDPESYILYRQHSNNAIGSDHMTYRHGFLNIYDDLRTPKPEKRVVFFDEFIKTYQKDLSDDAKKYLLRFVNYKKLRNRLYILLNPRLYGYQFKTTLAFKIRLMLGRMY